MVDRFYNLGDIFRSLNLTVNDILNAVNSIDQSITSVVSVTGPINSHMYGSVDGGNTFDTILIDSSGRIITKSILQDSNGNNLTSSSVGGLRGLDVNIISPIDVTLTGLATEQTLSNVYTGITGTNQRLDTTNAGLSTIYFGITG